MHMTKKNIQNKSGDEGYGTDSSWKILEMVLERCGACDSVLRLEVRLTGRGCGAVIVVSRIAGGSKVKAASTSYPRFASSPSTMTYCQWVNHQPAHLLFCALGSQAACSPRRQTQCADSKCGFYQNDNTILHPVFGTPSQFDSKCRRPISLN